MVKKSFLDMLFRARFTYIIIGILFILVGCFQEGFSFSNSFFGAGVVVLVVGIVLVLIHRGLKKKW